CARTRSRSCAFHAAIHSRAKVSTSIMGADATSYDPPSMSEISVAVPTRHVVGRTHEVRVDGTRIHLRTCPLCECMCGLELHFDADARVKRIRAYRDDVRSKGYLCPKGTTLGHLHQDPDRVRVPLIRDGDRFRDATWP